MLYQLPLAPEYAELSERELGARIRAAKAKLGGRLVILGHHYQQDDVVQFADITGDSLKLSQLAAKQQNAEFVVFCGVHFMAESADILTDDRVVVTLPDLSAKCMRDNTIAGVWRRWHDFNPGIIRMVIRVPP